MAMDVSMVYYIKYTYMRIYVPAFWLKAKLIFFTMDGSELARWFWRVFFSCRKLKHVIRYSVQANGYYRHTHYLRVV
jgi:hypothetical protein